MKYFVITLLLILASCKSLKFEESIKNYNYRIVKNILSNPDTLKKIRYIVKSQSEDLLLSQINSIKIFNYNEFGEISDNKIELVEEIDHKICLYKNIICIKNSKTDKLLCFVFMQKDNLEWQFSTFYFKSKKQD